MADLREFREKVREHRRAVGRTQQQLARSIGLHPDVLSHKLNGRDNAVLTTPDVIGIADHAGRLGGAGQPGGRVRAARPDGGAAARRPGRGLVRTAAGRPARLTDDGLPGHGAARHRGPRGARARPPADELPGARAGGARRARPRLTAAPLPAPATPLIGRERERAEVAAAVAAPGWSRSPVSAGTGKTRLALQAASDLAGDFADGVAFIDLAPVDDPRCWLRWWPGPWA